MRERLLQIMLSHLRTYQNRFLLKDTLFFVEKLLLNIQILKDSRMIIRIQEIYVLDLLDS